MAVEIAGKEAEVVRCGGEGGGGGSSVGMDSCCHVIDFYHSLTPAQSPIRIGFGSLPDIYPTFECRAFVFFPFRFFHFYSFGFFSSCIFLHFYSLFPRGNILHLIHFCHSTYLYFSIPLLFFNFVFFSMISSITNLSPLSVVSYHLFLPNLI